MQLKSILQSRAANSVNLTVKMTIYSKEWDFWVLLLVTISGYFKVDYLCSLLKNNVVIKEKLHDDNRMAAKTSYLINYDKFNVSIL